MSKNIVICCDGTNNEVAGDQTNVLRLFRMLERNDQQHAFYDAGVGTKADPTAFWPWRRFVRKKLDMAVGMSIRPNVLAAYRFVMDHYEDGDRIYLFGFSRGAYTVRALAGMMNRCGLLLPNHADLVEYAWSIYSDEDRSRNKATQFGGPARIKKVFSRPDFPIHFVGVWDTVSFVGWLWDPLTLPNTRTNKFIEHLRHAISIDEMRSFFHPNHVAAAEGQDCEAVWFAGVHADVGGGYPSKQSGLARIALRWMLGEAKKCDLRIDPAGEQEMLADMSSAKEDDALAEQHNEAKKIGWRVLSLLPRIMYKAVKVEPKNIDHEPESTKCELEETKRDAEKVKLVRRLSLWNWEARRVIPEKSKIHVSVRQRCDLAKNPAYEIKLPKEFTWVGEHLLPDGTKIVP